MKQKVLLLSHCFLNDGTKLRNADADEFAMERTSKRAFLKQALDSNIELLQLPCPEFLLYGSNRWGHASSQFDTPFFRRESKKLLEDIVLQLMEYTSHPERFEILGIIGIDGSPSCGIHLTYDGNWGGEFSGNSDLPGTLSSLHKVSRSGIFMEVFQEMLSEHALSIPFYTLADFPYRLFL